MENKKIKLKKSLGQNFLKSKAVVQKMISASLLKESDTVLEIGPGSGVLTEELLKHGVRVLAVEKDKRMSEFLKEKFSNEIKKDEFLIYETDILDFKPEIEISGEYKIIANIPYYITGEILRKFLSESYQPSLMTLLVQKEVAERIARDKKSSILSLSVRAFGNPKMIEKVSKKLFSPAPKVDSAILSIVDISKERLGTIPQDFFFRCVRTGFTQKRKFLLQNLSNIFEKEKIKNAFLDLEIDLKIRAEDLDFSKWLSLVEILNQESV